tara:strand:- start:1438 stop:1620 length:183 start_codon:yes stop_codon:yes gene_type:complete
MNTEQEVIDSFFPDDNTKTITDVISQLKQAQIDAGWVDITDTIVKNELKTTLSDISDWTF